MNWLTHSLRLQSMPLLILKSRKAFPTVGGSPCELYPNRNFRKRLQINTHLSIAIVGLVPMSKRVLGSRSPAIELASSCFLLLKYLLPPYRQHGTLDNVPTRN